MGTSYGDNIVNHGIQRLKNFQSCKTMDMEGGV